MMILNKLLLPLLVSFLLLSSCDSKKWAQTPDSQFTGTWLYEGSSIYDGVTIEIRKNEKGSLQGRLKTLNNNKLVQLFADTNDVVIPDIARNSNFQFTITQNRIGKELFGLYDLETSDKYTAEFVHPDLIGLNRGTGNPKDAPIKLRKIK